VTAPALKESDAWPAQPQDGYGLEKLVAEELTRYAACRAADSMHPEGTAGPHMRVRIARFHNVYGQQGTWTGGREKAPAAFLRKALAAQAMDAVAAAAPADAGAGAMSGVTPARIEVWGDGTQQRSFLHIDDAVSGVMALMCCNAPDADKPVNIGSTEAVTIRELAITAAMAVGWERHAAESRLWCDTSGPRGVDDRNSDNTRAAALLTWTPTVSLADGLERTGTWMRSQLTALAGSDVASARGAAAIRHALSSRSVACGTLSSGPSRRFALLVPATSKAEPATSTARDCRLARDLTNLLASIANTVPALSKPAERCVARLSPHRCRLAHLLSPWLRRCGTGDLPPAWHFDIIFGVDRGDRLLDPAQHGAIDTTALVRQALPLGCATGAVHTWVHVMNHPPGHICAMWADLARVADAAGAEFSVLLGDDVTLLTPGWHDRIAAEFQAIADRTGLPYGFGCVAFADTAFPGFPTFPVWHRTHMRAFNRAIFPPSFINQDADPYLFQVYRAFNAATLLPDVQLCNGVGGAQAPRYHRQHVPWTGSTLSSARQGAAEWALSRLPADQRHLARPGLTLDVVVPTYRAPDALLRRILALRVPAGVTTQFTLVFDRPDHPSARAVADSLQKEHATNPFVRIRTNESNLGASESRNRGLRESAADWVLFLDDDVEPADDLLVAYAQAITAHPRATGFIGLSELAPPETARQAGVHMAGVAFFWTAARAFAGSTNLPWGVTANLCIRRPPPETRLTFDPHGVFPRAGGGEDIDFCLRLRDWTAATVTDSEGFVATPAARVRHPWWDGGRPALSHFSGWASGDGHLIDLFPRFTYWNLPELGEWLLVLTVAAAVTACVSAVAHGASAVMLRWLCFYAAVAMAVTGADLAFDAVNTALFEPPSEPQIAQLPMHVWIGGLVWGLIIRTWSECGRMRGHCRRGRLPANMFRRFNWFGDMWPGAVKVERSRAMWRNCVRIAVLAAVVRWLGVV